MFFLTHGFSSTTHVLWLPSKQFLLVQSWSKCRLPTDKSRYFAITEFNNCFIIRSPSLFFNYLRSDLPFSRKNDRKKEKSVVSFTHEQNYICNQTHLGDIAHEQTIICKQLFAGNVMGPQPMKRKKNLHRRIFLMLRPAVSRVLLQ